MNAFTKGAALALAFLALLSLGGCGSGAVGDNTPPPAPGPIQVIPANATVYSGVPATFLVTGGTGAFTVVSSDQNVIANSTGTGSSFNVVANPVSADTPVSLTVLDNAGSQAAVALTVRPRTVSNTITITPGSAVCAPAVCSGGDAVVAAMLSQGGIPLSGRAVRFEVVSGDFRFVSSPPGQPEALALAVSATTDELGQARARLRVLNTAGNQVAILKVTDLVSGANQQTTFFVAQASASASGFFALPTAVTFTGPRTDACATGLSADVFIFGGTPGYNILNSAPSALVVSPNVVTSSGSSFRITTTGVCTENATIGITDAAGRTISIAVTNKPGTVEAPALPALTVAPSSVVLSDCNGVANVTIAGGTGSYTAVSGSGVVLATIAGNTLSIRRVNPSSAPAVTSVSVGVSDGVSTRTVTVQLAGAAGGSCPSQAAGTISASPNQVTLTSCFPENVVLSGGVAPYQIQSVSTSALEAALVPNSLGPVGPNTVRIGRALGSPGFTAPGFVTVTDGVSSLSIPVQATIGGAGQC